MGVVTKLRATLLAVLVIVAATAGTLLTTASAQTRPHVQTTAKGRADAQLAAANATSPLASLTLPAGSTQVGSDPAGAKDLQMARSDSPLLYQAQVDHHAFYTSSATPRAVVTSVEQSLPADAGTQGYGTVGAALMHNWTLPTVDPLLTDGGALLQKASKILGVKLTRS